MRCSFKTIAWAILLCLIAGNAQGTIDVEALSPGKSLYASLAEEPGSQNTSQLYLPFIANSLLSFQGAPIWAHHSTPFSHEVVLFRRAFDFESPVEDAELVLFADTRYQAWLDGAWLGQGPARFSRLRQEEDHYLLGDLQAGQHTLSVLVQWAPNNRRSESVRPLLQSRLLGKQGGSQRVLARSGPDWQAQQSPAWQKDAAPVHTWGLIGPTELLDLRLLPADWNQTGGADPGWQEAVIVDSGEVFYQPMRSLRIEPEKALTQIVPEYSRLGTLEFEAAPTVIRQARSIPFFSRTPVPIRIIDAGLLSPGWKIGEIPPFQPMPFTVHLTTTLPATLTLGMLDAYPGVSLDSALFHLVSAVT